MRKIYLLPALSCLFFLLMGLNCYSQNKPVFSIPFQLIDNRPFIEVKIKQHTFHFVLDCGADYGLNTTTAQILGLDLGHKSMQGGAGAKLAETWQTIVDTIKIGPVNVIKNSFRVIDFSEIINGLHLPYMDGVIGYTFMKDYAVQFDYRNNVINFYNSYKGPYPLPFTYFYGSVPEFAAEIDENKAIVIVDTGDRTGFTLLNHFAVKTGIIKNYHLSDTTITGYGLGGPIYARTFILNKLAIANIKAVNVPSRIPMLKTGAFADTNIDGSIGGGVLKQYKFTIDYKKQLLYFE
ncbi:aspartyl protease family protein [Mucilaginibacter sp.]|uniref:aspartyl protease family protein n=1 Tax=Mucilaginibacter sp. TaxID=1882438 RepID=UPI00284B0976|nr:aspartyl protease family protein [Mucilaginibacter sp.]MDR3697961.1 aspartyl protease family protein [Mucilaginibacter sp.]